MKTALIVAHGQPSDPLPMARTLEALADEIAKHLPDWQIRAATLAEAGALERARGLAPGLVFPMFMAAGWFTRVALPKRLAEAGLAGWRITEPFGIAPQITALALEVIRASGASEVLIAAHGSFRAAEPALVAEALAQRVRMRLGLPARAAFIDQSPQLAHVTGFGAGAVCLPFFAMAGGHVTEDLPQALQEAGFPGRILPALGLDPRVPEVIAGLLRTAARGLEA